MNGFLTNNITEFIQKFPKNRVSYNIWKLRSLLNQYMIEVFDEF